MEDTKNQNITGIITTTVGVLSLFWGLLVALYSLIDPLSPMFAYIAIPFVLLSSVFGHKRWLIVKLFGTLFVLSHFVAFWTINDIEGKATIVKSSEFFDENIFIKCSEAMFKGFRGDQKQLTVQQKTNFNICVDQEQ